MITLIKKIYPYLFFILLLVLPFEQYIIAVPNILLIGLVAFSPFVFHKSDFNRIKRTPFLLYVGFGLYLFLSSLLFGKINENLSVTLKVCFPLVLVILYLPIKNEKILTHGIIYSSLAAILFSVIKIGMLVYRTGNFEFGTGMNPVETLPTDRIYLGLLCVISVVLAYKAFVDKINVRKWFYLASILINILFLFLIVSRMAIITLVVLLVIRYFYLKNNRKSFLISLGAMVLVALVSIGINDNIKKRFLLITPNPNRTFKERLFLMEPRTKIWDCAIKIAPTGAKFFTGLGFETTVDSLVNCYEWNIADNPERRDWYMLQRYNTHNQFLDFYLSTGILSALFFLGILILLLIQNRKDYFKVSLLLSFIMFAVVESFFHRQVGAYYFGIVLIYLLYTNSFYKSEEKSPKALKRDL